MIKYYYSLDGQQLGPVTIEELKTIGITKDTLVWKNGMDDWKAARLVEELDFIFEPTPPPLQTENDLEVTPVNKEPLEEVKHEAAARPEESSKSTTTTASATSPKTPLYPKPFNWLVPSILVTLFCCLPFGIVSIIYASKVDRLYFAGDYIGAVKSSSSAKKWVLIAAALGVIAAIIYLLVSVAAIGMELESDRYDFGGYYM